MKVRVNHHLRLTARQSELSLIKTRPAMPLEQMAGARGARKKYPRFAYELSMGTTRRTCIEMTGSLRLPGHRAG
jgi:hypothetical protein